MHESSLLRMAEMRVRVPAGSRVLDFGGNTTEGSYRHLFPDCEYVTLDFHDADVLVTSYEWPLRDASFDHVVSGQALEHDKFFLVTMRNVARVLRPGGLFLLIVPAGEQCCPWGIHRYPVDCWRFLPDAVAALAEWAGLEEVDARIVGPDLCGVMRKPARPRQGPAVPLG